MSGRKIGGAILVIAVLVVILVSSIMPSWLSPRGQTGVIPKDSPPVPQRGFYMGVLPTPRVNQSFADSFKQASTYSDFVPVWGRPTPFYDLGADLSGSWGETFVDTYTRLNRMFPLVHLSFIGEDMSIVCPPGLQGATLSDPRWREFYKQAALDAVRATKPLYLSLGNEVNRWYEKYGAKAGDPNCFQNFVSLYEEIYAAVKALSNKTTVFCVFAREIVSERKEADLEVLKLFNPARIDLLALTSYPFAVQRRSRPSDIPDDYYKKASQYMPQKPFALTETAWSSHPYYGGEQAQSDFLSQVTGRLTSAQGINMDLLGWAWLHDIGESDYIGMVKRDGNEKLVYKTWKNVFTGA